MQRARKRYVGLDVHKDVVEYCILDAAGKKIDGGRIMCEQSVLLRFATTTLSSKDHVALESTTNTWSVVRYYRTPRCQGRRWQSHENQGDC